MSFILCMHPDDNGRQQDELTVLYRNDPHELSSCRESMLGKRAPVEFATAQDAALVAGRMITPRMIMEVTIIKGSQGEYVSISKTANITYPPPKPSKGVIVVGTDTGGVK